MEWWKSILAGLALYALGIGLLWWSSHSDMSYTATAGSPGWGVEGPRDATLAVKWVAGVAFLWGTYHLYKGLSYFRDG